MGGANARRKLVFSLFCYFLTDRVYYFLFKQTGSINPRRTSGGILVFYILVASQKVVCMKTSHITETCPCNIDDILAACKHSCYHFINILFIGGRKLATSCYICSVAEGNFSTHCIMVHSCFVLWLSDPVNSYGHIEILPPIQN